MSPIMDLPLAASGPQASIGHNSGFADYWQLRMAVWDSKEPLVVKAMALAILEYMRPDMLNASVSRSRIMKMCGIAEKTLERHWDAICQWVEVIKETGKRNTYRARIYACASELIEMIPPTAPPPTVTGGQKEPPVRMTTSHNDTTPQKVPDSVGGGVGKTTPHSDYHPPESTRLCGGYQASRANKDLKTIITTNNNMDASELVRVNGTNITGPGFVMTYREIDYAATMAGATSERGRAIAEILALDWARKGFVPTGNPIAMVKKAIRNEQVQHEEQKAKLKRVVAAVENAPAQPPRIYTSSSRESWQIRRDEEAENKRRVDEAIRNFDWGTGKAKVQA